MKSLLNSLTTICGMKRIYEVPYGFCACGCGNKTTLAPQSHTAKGWVKGEPLRFCRGHKLSYDPLDNYKVDANGCWIWQRALGRAGYGIVTRGQGSEGQMPAHRWFYEHEYGPIPEGLHLDHLCKTHACVNPEHLEAVSCIENIRRGKATKLSLQDARRIKSSEKTNKALAGLYGVDPSTISHLRRGFTWKDA